MKISVRVSTRASKSEITGFRDGALHVRLSAPPVDGKANDDLVATIARALEISRSSVQIVKGHTARNKILEIAADEAVIRRLGAP